MSISIIVNGIKYPSKMSYYRTLEPQGTRSDAAFYVHMRLIHGSQYRKSEIVRQKKKIMKRYYSDLEYKKQINANRTKYYRSKRDKREFEI